MTISRGSSVHSGSLGLESLYFALIFGSTNSNLHTFDPEINLLFKLSRDDRVLISNVLFCLFSLFLIVFIFCSFLARGKSISIEDLSTERDETNFDDDVEPTQWKRVSKIRRSLQFPRKTAPK